MDTTSRAMEYNIVLTTQGWGQNNWTDGNE